jgi:hypothetical protein
MGLRGELFTTEISLDNRTYFFNVKENRTGDVFLQVVESKNVEGTGFDRHAIVVFEDDMQKFLQGLETTLKFIEKNHKSRVKDTAEKGDSGKKKFVRRKSEGAESSRDRGTGRGDSRGDSRTDARSDGRAEPKANGKPKRVKVISKKRAD